MLMRHGFITAHILCYRDVSLRARLAVSGWVPSISQLFVLLLVTIYWPVRSVSSSNCTILVMGILNGSTSITHM